MKLIGKLIGTVFPFVVKIFYVQGIASGWEGGAPLEAGDQPKHLGGGATMVLGRGSAQSGWTQRALSQNIPLQLERDGITNTYTVTSAPAQVGTVNELMRQKYGWRDQFISLMAPREASVVLRLTAVS
ncbi:MAG: hypothetical protein CM15mP120_06520 [Pseudomonadota bacterium]|nr:MAG: hypothetical protein CM15mP120_06520 [Pseudomonadota bacterium]